MFDFLKKMLGNNFSSDESHEVIERFSSTEKITTLSECNISTISDYSTFNCLLDYYSNEEIKEVVEKFDQDLMGLESENGELVCHREARRK